MSDPLPQEVNDHILEFMDKREPKRPPNHAFTAKQYYAKLLERCERDGVPEDELPTADTIRRKLMKDNLLNKRQYPGGGPTYFWQKREQESANKED